MGQEEILSVLEKSRVPLSAEEIARELNNTIIKILGDIKKLLQYNEIQCIELNKDLAMKFYRCKRKMRLYHI